MCFEMFRRRLVMKCDTHGILANQLKYQPLFMNHALTTLFVKADVLQLNLEPKSNNS